MGQVATRDQPLPGPLRCLDTVFDRLEPTTEDREQEARLRGVGLVAAGFAQREDPPDCPVCSSGVAAQRHSGRSGVTGRAEQGGAWAVLKPDPQRFQAQPRVQGGVGD